MGAYHVKAYALAKCSKVVWWFCKVGKGQGITIAKAVDRLGLYKSFKIVVCKREHLRGRFEVAKVAIESLIP